VSDPHVEAGDPRAGGKKRWLSCAVSMATPLDPSATLLVFGALAAVLALRWRRTRRSA
jgi:hypothetical protein